MSPRTFHLMLGISLLACSLVLSACPQEKAKTGTLGKGGLPTNTIAPGAGVEGTGTALAVPPEIIYPGATEIAGRPHFYQTDASIDVVYQWLVDHVPGAGDRKPLDSDKMLVSPDWTMELYGGGGKAVVRYKNKKFLGKSAQ
ncbi:MAG: hypothetical protein ABI743_00350 [bacterium]